LLERQCDLIWLTERLALLQLIQDKLSELIKLHYPAIAEEPLRDPVLFGDYRLAKHVS
jgi:hypothetical protein